MEDESPGVPEWIVTYGDMMSLLLTFFIMLVSLSEVVAEEKYRAILDSLQKYTGYKPGPDSPPGKHFPLNSLIEQLQTLGSFTDKERGTRGIRTSSVKGTSMKILRTREGKSLKAGQSLAFSPGQESISQEVKRQLVVIAKEIGGKPNKIEIRGHVSPGPLPEGSDATDKTILSYIRARKVLTFLQEQDIDTNRVRIVAYADLQPVHLTGDKNEVKHDRVEVVIIDMLAEKYIGPAKEQE
jgi:chemotaxis protein MotB